MDEIIEHKAHARVGLLGNPSDVYYGRTISFSLGNFWATVKLEPSDHLIIKPHPVHDLVQFQSLHHLVSLSLFLFGSQLYYRYFIHLHCCLRSAWSLTIMRNSLRYCYRNQCPMLRMKLHVKLEVQMNII